ncbi:polysaccharide biosynthesis/export family protein, partial [Candidatus Riflebacteria bacterium]
MGYPELNSEFTLDKRGCAKLPFIGELKLGGLEIQKATKKIENRYKKGYLKYPVVKLRILSAKKSNKNQKAALKKESQKISAKKISLVKKVKDTTKVKVHKKVKPKFKVTAGLTGPGTKPAVAKQKREKIKRIPPVLEVKSPVKVRKKCQK